MSTSFRHTAASFEILNLLIYPVTNVICTSIKCIPFLRDSLEYNLQVHLPEILHFPLVMADKVGPTDSKIGVFKLAMTLTNDVGHMD